MKPLTTDLQDEETLRDLGRASVQIVHDLKNQLNGLKLYATFLRKRMEKGDRPADELETIGKLIAGLERAAGDMNVLVRLGRPLELARQRRTDLARLLSQAREGRPFAADGGAFEGEFDPGALTDALKSIDAGACGTKADGDDGPKVHLRREDSGGEPAAVVEWRGARANGEGDIFSSFAGSAGLRMALAARVIRAHGGEVAHEAGTVRVHLPLEQ
jgi:signal transduction histidine kinase